MLLSGHNILVVEDDPLVLFDICQHLRSLGAYVTSAYRLPEALQFAGAPGLTAAILDHKLSSADTSAVCAILERRQIPFVVYTGYPNLHGACSKGELIQKPASVETLVAAMMAAIAKAPSAPMH